MYNRRLQIRLDEPRYRRLIARARGRKVSVAVVVREAIDLAVRGDVEEREPAGRRILAAEPMPVPASIEQLKSEPGTIRAAGP